MNHLKNSFVQYLRIIVRAKIETSGSLVGTLIEKLKDEVAKGTTGRDEKRGFLTYEETTTLELFVDLMHAKVPNGLEGRVRSDSSRSGVGDEGRPAKRQRSMSNSTELDWLLGERMFPKRSDGSHPRWYMQVLFLYLVKYPEDIPLDVCEELVKNFSSAFQQGTFAFEDLDNIWAMRCLEELLVINQRRVDDAAQPEGAHGVWAQIYSSVLNNIINGRRSKRVELFEVAALNLLTSMVSEGSVVGKDIEERGNMSIVWKLLVTHWGKGMELQAKNTSSVSRSMHASQAKELNAGRPPQDPVQVDVALTSFLVSLLHRVPLSDDSISVEGVTCSRKGLLNILCRKVEEWGQHVQGRQSVTRLNLTARLMTATMGLVREIDTCAHGKKLSCSAWHMRDLVSGTRREGVDIFSELDGEYMDVYAHVRGRSGPDFTLLGDRIGSEGTPARFRRPRGGVLEDRKFECTLTSIGKVTGWSSRTSCFARPDACNKWAVHLQLPQEEVRKLSIMCLDMLERHDDPGQDSPDSAFSPKLVLAVCLLDISTATPAANPELIAGLYDYILKNDVILKTRDTLRNWKAVRTAERVSMFEALEDIVDSLLCLLAQRSNLGQLDPDFVKLTNALGEIKKYCGEEMSNSAEDSQPGTAMDWDDDFAVGPQRNEHQEKALAYARIRFRLWVKISSAMETIQKEAEKLDSVLAGLSTRKEVLEHLNALCNFGIPKSGTWKYAVDLVRLADEHAEKGRECSFDRPRLLCLKIASFLVERLGEPGLNMPTECKKKLLESICTHALEWHHKDGPHSNTVSKGLPKRFNKAHRSLRLQYVACAAQVVPHAAECSGSASTSPTAAQLMTFISSRLNDISIEVRGQAAKGLGLAIRAFTPRHRMEGIREILQNLKKLDDDPLVVGEDAKIRSRAFVYGEISALDDECVSADVQAYCLAMLCSIFARQTDGEIDGKGRYEDVVRGILDNIARCQEFPESTELVRAHMPSILREWYYQSIVSQEAQKDAWHWTAFPLQLAGYCTMNAFVMDFVAPTLVAEIVCDRESSARDQELNTIGKYLNTRQSTPPRAIIATYFAHMYSRIMSQFNLYKERQSGHAARAGTLQDAEWARYKRGYDCIKEHKNEARIGTLKKEQDLIIGLLDIILKGGLTRWDPDDKNTDWSASSNLQAVFKTLQDLPRNYDPELYFIGIRRSATGVPLQPQVASLAAESQSQASNSTAEQQGLKYFCPDLLPQIYLHLLRALKGQGGRKATRPQKERVLEALKVIVWCLGSLLTTKIDKYPVRSSRIGECPVRSSRIGEHPVRSWC
jgi:hypothetical protein